VAAMLRGTSQKPDTVVIKALTPEGLGVTVEKVAINGVMAGCKPRHMPVLLAALEAYNLHNKTNSLVRSTNAFSFMQVVNGPIRKELAMNAGTSVLVQAIMPTLPWAVLCAYSSLIWAEECPA